MRRRTSGGGAGVFRSGTKATMGGIFDSPHGGSPRGNTAGAGNGLVSANGSVDGASDAIHLKAESAPGTPLRGSIMGASASGPTGEGQQILSQLRHPSQSRMGRSSLSRTTTNPVLGATPGYVDEATPITWAAGYDVHHSAARQG